MIIPYDCYYVLHAMLCDKDNNNNDNNKSNVFFFVVKRLLFCLRKTNTKPPTSFVFI